MPRSFNTAGPCLAEDDYMLPPCARLPQVRRFIDAKKLLRPSRAAPIRQDHGGARAGDGADGGRGVRRGGDVHGGGGALWRCPGAAEVAILSSWRRAAEAHLPTSSPRLRGPRQGWHALGDGLDDWSRKLPDAR